MADKFISLDSGVMVEKEASTVGGSATYAGQIPALDAAGRLSETMMPVGVGADVATATAYEALSASNPFVYIKSDGTVANASAASGGNPCMAFVQESFASGATDVSVYFEGQVTTLSGLTPGARYYLSAATSGGLTDTPVSDSGQLHQYIGRAVSATVLSFEAEDHIVRA